MAVGDIFEAQIESLVVGGEGLAHWEGKPIFVFGTLPGEQIVGRVLEEHRSWARAHYLEIRNRSKHHCGASCYRYGVCGGCNFQHVRHEAQLPAKAEILKETCKRIGKFEPPEPTLVFASPFEYRNRLRFHLPPAQPGLFGLKARRSAAVVPLEDCSVADRAIRTLIKTAAMGGDGPSFAPGENCLPVYACRGLFLAKGRQERGRVSILNRELLIDLGAFFQGNAESLEYMIQNLMSLAAGADRNRPIADIYAGVGTFAAFLAEGFPQVDLVESNALSMELARENLAGYPASFFAMRDDVWAQSMEAVESPYGFIVADPPRSGISVLLRRWLAEHGPPLFAYVSCDPASFARDAAALLNGGYTLSSLRLYDCYPQTAHIESIAVFTKG
jgi:23S rRNA (uracil1939-C5)-methyltransferase